MIILGISGAIQSGKTTLAQLLTDTDSAHSVHMETSTIIVELADDFNAALASRLELLRTDKIGAINEILETLASALSHIANTELRVADIAVRSEDVAAAPEWYSKLFAYFQQVTTDPSVVTQPITSQNKSIYRSLLQWIGGYVLYRLEEPLLWYKELKRRIDDLPPDVSLVALTAPRQPAEAEYVQSIGGRVVLIERPELVADRTDVTERRVAEIIPDIRVINDSSLKALQACAVRLRSDLFNNRPQAEYRASSYDA